MRAKLLVAVLVCGLAGSGCAGTSKDGPTENSARTGSDASQLSSSGEGGWQDLIADIAGQVFLAAENGVLFYAYDVLAYPGQKVKLQARVQLAKLLEGVPGVTVGFYQGSKLIGTDRTDRSGRAAVDWRPPEQGNYSLTAKINAVPSEEYREMLSTKSAPLLVAAHDKKKPFVVIDLDHTVVDSSFFRVLLGRAKPMANSVTVTKKIAKTYGVVYLTQRPILLTRKSKSWLTKQKYPAGPVLLSELTEALAGSQSFKTSELALMRKSFPQVMIGIGDKPSDAQAYVDNGMTAYLLPHYKEKAKDLRKKAEEIRRLNGRGRLNVVDNWTQVEQGIFKGRQFPSEPFVINLRRRADLLAEIERRDDDDDD